MKWSKAEKDFIKQLRVARLATADSKGTPHNVPVCPVLEGEKIYFGTEAGGKKVRNIRVNRNVALVFDDYTDAWEHLRGIMVQGPARILGIREFRRMRKKLYAKYLQYATMAPLSDGDCVIVEVTPRRKFSWGIK